MDLPRNQILCGDAVQQLRRLPSASIDMAIFSPPYWQAKTYRTPGQFGQEATPEAWVANLVRVMRELRRAVKPWGTIWINVADVFSKGPRYGAPAKAALLLPERLLLALGREGFIVRSKVTWFKSNGQPTSARDRLATRTELLVLVVMQKQYFFALDEIRTPLRGRRSTAPRPAIKPWTYWSGPLGGTQAGLYRRRHGGLTGDPLGANPGDCWAIPTAGFRGPHPAAFPKELVRRPILAGCPERTCDDCGRPWRRNRVVGGCVPPMAQSGGVRVPVLKMRRGWLVPGCDCGGATRPGIVLDPFIGSGTTAVVARSLGRDFVGIEISAAFCRLAEQRLRDEVRA